MDVAKPQVKSCKTSEYFRYVHKYLYLVGWPNYWNNDFDLPTVIIKYHDNASKILNAACLFFVAFELIGFITQNNLSEKQQTDRQLFGFSHPFLGSFGIILAFHQEKISALTNTMVIELKKHYNDPDMEMQMIKKSRRHSMVYCFICSFALISYGLDGLMQCLYDKGRVHSTAFLIATIATT